MAAAKATGREGGGGFNVTFVGALSGKTLAIVDVLPYYCPPLPPRDVGQYPTLMPLFGQPWTDTAAATKSNTSLSSPPREAGIRLLDAFKRANLNPYTYHIVIEDVPLDPEKMQTYIIRGSEDVVVELVSRESMLEVQWFLSSEAQFEGQAMQCPDVLPTTCVPNDTANVESAITQLLPTIPVQYTNLIKLIHQDILMTPKIRRRKLNVAREYDYERSLWVVRCALIVTRSGCLTLRLTGNHLHTHDEAGVAANVDTIMRNIDNIIM